ncbi:MAG: DUF1499 domain-containing protein [Bacteriovoracaceae bacterium]|jgi:uncharacterized protein (DUF1499 family)|nr:DUF1499 domain-containing protein [Bacteriovoracaceae bacterium]
MKKCCYAVLLILGVGCAGQRPAELGVNQKKLNGCPDKSNCVSSFATSEKHMIDPIGLKVTGPAEMDKFVSIVEKMGGKVVTKEGGTYIYAEFTSTVFRFVDDVEIYINSDAGKAFIRSASRIGESDFGVNRKRMEELRFRYHQML